MKYIQSIFSIYLYVLGIYSSAVLCPLSHGVDFHSHYSWLGLTIVYRVHTRRSPTKSFYWPFIPCYAYTDSFRLLKVLMWKKIIINHSRRGSFSRGSQDLNWLSASAFVTVESNLCAAIHVWRVISANTKTFI